jgi:hypothetical protein
MRAMRLLYKTFPIVTTYYIVTAELIAYFPEELFTSDRPNEFLRSLYLSLRAKLVKFRYVRYILMVGKRSVGALWLNGNLAEEIGKSICTIRLFLSYRLLVHIDYFLLNFLFASFLLFFIFLFLFLFLLILI